VYLPREDDVQNPNLIAFLHFFSFIIVLNTLVPISLYVRYERSCLPEEDIRRI
jgi:hypothetical protein